MDKVDKYQIESIKQELATIDVVIEELGGDTLSVEVSAKSGEGVEDLVDSILLQVSTVALCAFL